MKKSAFLLPFVLLPALFACGNGNESSPVKLDFGTRIGLDEEISFRSHLKFVKKSKVNQLVADKGNFILLVHGAADTCTCYTEFHEKVLVPYVKHHKALIYAIDLDEFESDGQYLGITRVVGSDTLAIFENGLAKYQHTTENLSDKWTHNYATFNEWMRERASDAKIFLIDEETLDSYYLDNDPFTIYFGLENCPDCRYLNRTGLRSYLQSHPVTEANFFYIDMAPFWGDAELKAEKMAKYGLSNTEANPNPIGFEKGYVPSVFYVNPDGIHFQGDVIEAAGVFYNESLTEGIIGHTYFTAERLEAGKDTYMSYLSSSSVGTKVLEGVQVETIKGATDWHDAVQPFEEPIFNALLDYAIGA